MLPPPPPPPPANPDLADQLKIERYKDLVERIRALNDGVHKYTTLFQTLVVALVVAGAAVVATWRSLNIPAETARVCVRGLEGALVILGVFLVGSILAGIRSWFDYRADEVRLLNEAMWPGYRQPPTACNLWRWPETYLVVLVVAVVSLVCGFVERAVIPLLQ